jgi:hypothetical protein
LDLCVFSSDCKREKCRFFNFKWDFLESKRFACLYAISLANFCNQGIKYCIERGYLYLFGELHYQMGRNLLLLNRKEESTMYLKKAISIFELENNISFMNYVEEELKSIEEQES